MGELIPFPKRNSVSGDPQKTVQNVQITSTPTLRIFAECQGLIHVFGEVPGHCVCGENYWGDDVIPNEQSR